MSSGRDQPTDPTVASQNLVRLEFLRKSRRVPAHNSVWPENIGVLCRPFYGGRHANDPVRDSFSALLPVSAPGLPGTGGVGPQASGGRSPPAAARPTVASSGRPPAVGLALPSLAALPEGDGAGQAGDRDPVAPAGLPQILALAVKLAPPRTAGRESRDS
jgi:hypothetical protein